MTKPEAGREEEGDGSELVAAEATESVVQAGSRKRVLDEGEESREVEVVGASTGPVGG